MKNTTPSAEELLARLERLRTLCAHLRARAKLGREVRAELLAAGSAVWPAAEEYRWDTWIERHGDEYARLFLSAMHVALEERAASLKADAPAEEAPGLDGQSHPCAQRAQEVHDGAL